MSLEHFKIGERVLVYTGKHSDNSRTMGTRIWELGTVTKYVGDETDKRIGTRRAYVELDDGRYHIACLSKFKRAYTNDIRPLDYHSGRD